MNHRVSLEHVTRLRRAELTPEICKLTNNTVIDGPFNGMFVTEQSSWGDGDAAPKLLGIYEQELYPVIEQIIAARPEVVVNVGCAEGFYAVGLARRLVQSQVIAADIVQDSLNIALKNAAANDIKNLTIKNSCTAQELEQLIKNNQVTAVISDCEGYEIELLDPKIVPSLAKSHILVECHDMFNNKITPTLIKRFNSTHRAIYKISQGARNPFVISGLEKYSDSDKWALVNEIRGEAMHWLYMEPNA